MIWWPLSKVLDVNEKSEGIIASENASSKKPLTWTKCFRIHQSSIKCMDILLISEADIIITTGGDDNSIAFTRLSCLSKEPCDPTCSILRIAKAHASTITSIQHTPSTKCRDSLFTEYSYRIISSSNDQRLKSWLLSVDTSRPGVEGLTVMKEDNVYSEIADASCMAILPRGSNGTTAIVAGVGLEIRNIDN